MRASRAAALLLSTAAVASAAGQAKPPKQTFAAAGSRAVATLLDVYYAGNGLWRQCNASACATGNSDWGYDSLTFTLALRYGATHDPKLLAPLRALEQTAPTYSTPCADASSCNSWSDVPEWDTIALVDEYLATADQPALKKAQAAFDFVDRSTVYALGACPNIPYQQPGGGGNRLKTLETEANAVKAALLLYRATRDPRYLSAATTGYAAIRTYFLDPDLPLYSVYVFDEAGRCTSLTHRFFASVNGDMIWSGLELHRDTGESAYRAEAVATGKAVDRYLSDPRGIFTDLQAENDVVEPLVEGMDALATSGQTFARNWILRNAAAALSARAPDGSFGRFFDGPPPATTTTAWQTNGGLALEIAAAALAPHTAASVVHTWAHARRVLDDVASLPARITFHGSGIALYGAIGEQCCESGHARVFVDGRATVDQTGIWQNKSSAGRPIPNTLLFAWRWPHSGTHTLVFQPGLPNPKEGTSFLHLAAYAVLR
ncbi:MAG: hypothetical protein ACRDL2_14750 [Gaiellaceae bacterium]